MDILNWLRIKKQNLIRTTLDSPKDLVMLGADVSFQKRGDKYQSYAMPAEDFLATAARPYKVFTALLTQSGGSVYSPVLGDETLNKGITYTIDNLEAGDSLIPYGAPNNEIGTSFICNQEISNWGNPLSQLSFDSGAPVVTVLENTIGNVWFTYDSEGNYGINCNGLFNNNIFIPFPMGNANAIDGKTYFQIYNISNSKLEVITYDQEFTPVNFILNNTPIEIRVYN